MESLVDEASGLDRFDRFLHRRELQVLRRALQDGEEVLAAVEALHGKAGVLAATNRRLIFVRKTWLGGRTKSWPHARIERTVQRDASTLNLQATAGPVTFLGVPKAQSKHFLAVVAKRPLQPGELLEFNLSPREAAQRARLARLDRMLARGSVTRTEYERAKANLGDDEDAGP